ncbi:MAG: cupin domain-containing protein [Chloroflexi bacterium]|nr:cupin domain-containing protein [Chloroflexota bacterium]
MAAQQKYVFKLPDVPFIESPDGAMRDSVMVTEQTCGSKQFTAGLFFVRPGAHGHPDTHVGIEELFYIIQGQANIMMDDEPVHVKAGDVVFVPAGVKHQVFNTGDVPYCAYWAIGAKWNSLPDIQRELGKWNKIKPDSDWGTPT